MFFEEISREKLKFPTPVDRTKSVCDAGAEHNWKRQNKLFMMCCFSPMPPIRTMFFATECLFCVTYFPHDLIMPVWLFLPFTHLTSLGNSSSPSVFDSGIDRRHLHRSGSDCQLNRGIIDNTRPPTHRLTKLSRTSFRFKVATIDEIPRKIWFLLCNPLRWFS